VAVLRANLSLVADLDWDATSVKSVEAQYEVVEAGTPISLKGWNMMMVWVVQTFGGKVTMQQLMEQYVQTPASPFVQLVGAAGARAPRCCCCRWLMCMPLPARSAQQLRLCAPLMHQQLAGLVAGRRLGHA
jgi:hypothetical protein